MSILNSVIGSINQKCEDLAVGMYGYSYFPMQFTVRAFLFDISLSSAFLPHLVHCNSNELPSCMFGFVNPQFSCRIICVAWLQSPLPLPRSGPPSSVSVLVLTKPSFALALCKEKSQGMCRQFKMI